MASPDPAPGPHRPLPATPPRRAGSVRRTTTVDTPWPDFDAGRVRVAVRGQDLLTAADGTATVLDQFDVSLLVELAAGEILAVEGADRARVAGIEGGRLRAGFGRHLVGLLPAEGERRTLAYSVLDDLPGAFLVSGYAMLRAGLVGSDPAHHQEAIRRQADVCIGWATGSSMLVTLTEKGRTAVPAGPVAPVLEDPDPAGWHDLPDLGVQAMRRRRQLDVWAGDDGGLEVHSHLRDSYAAEDHEMALHEYVVEATVDAGGRIATVAADPRTLPWVECPGAVASAAGVVGVSLPDLGAKVRADLTGPATCTHLSSTLRALADVQSLAARLR